MRLSIVVPTYKRAKDLPRLFESIVNQKDLPDEVLILVGPKDQESLHVSALWSLKYPMFKIFESKKASLIHSINFGLHLVKEEIISLIDDDVWLPEDWSQKIKKAFSEDPLLGAYGGRDHLQLENESHLSNPPLARQVGIFRWDGTLIGNHHCGIINSPSYVNVLKGCNLSIRRSAFTTMRIDTILESQGAEICGEIDICQQIIKNGYHIIYDNDNYVLHYSSPRLDFDDRSNLFLPIIFKRVFNQIWVTTKYRPVSEIILFSARSFLIGSRFQPGVIWSFLLMPKFGLKALKLPWQYLKAILKGLSIGRKSRGLNNAQNLSVIN